MAGRGLQVVMSVIGPCVLVLLSGCQKIEMAYCQVRLPPSRLMVDFDPMHNSIDHQVDARTIGDAHGQDGESITYGLTTAHTSVKAEVKLHALKIPGAVCARPDVIVHLAYQPVTVEIARELPVESCGYSVVLGHEMKHLAVFRQQLGESAERMRHEIDARNLNQAVIYHDIDAAQKAMQTMQDDWLVPRATAFLNEASGKQSAVDNPAEYQRVAAACPGNTLLTGETAPDAARF